MKKYKIGSLFQDIVDKHLCILIKYESDYKVILCDTTDGSYFLVTHSIGTGRFRELVSLDEQIDS